MRKRPVAWLVLALASLALGAEAAPCAGVRNFVSPDGRTTVEIRQSGRYGCGESLVRVKPEHGPAVAESFASSDGEHGYGVEDARWTPDSRFLVLTLTNSGGHQALNHPISIFDRRKARFVSPPLPEDFLPSAVRVRAGDVLEVTGWDIDRRALATIRIDLSRSALRPSD